MRGCDPNPLIPLVARPIVQVTAAPAWSTQLLCAFSDAAGAEGTQKWGSRQGTDAPSDVPPSSAEQKAAPPRSPAPNPSTLHHPHPLTLPALLRIPSLPALEALLSTSPPSSFTPTTLTHCYQRIGLLAPFPPDRPPALRAANHLTPHLLRHLPHLSHTQLATISWAFGRMHHIPPGLPYHLVWKQFKEDNFRKLRRCGPRELDWLLLAIVNCKLGGKGHFCNVVEALLPMLHLCTPHMLARLAYTLGEHPLFTHVPMMDALAAEALPLVPLLDTVQLTWLLHGYARCRHRPPNSLLPEVTGRLAMLLQRHQAASSGGLEAAALPRRTAGTTESPQPAAPAAAPAAPAPASLAAEEGTEGVEVRAPTAADLLSGETIRTQIPKAIWACAVLAHRDDGFLAAACDLLVGEKAHLARRQRDKLEVVMWGVGQLGFSHRGLLEASCEVMPMAVAKMQCGGLARVMCAWAKLGHYDSGAMELVCCALMGLLQRREGRERVGTLATILQSLAILHHSNPRLYTVMATSIGAKLQREVALYEAGKMGRRGGIDPEAVASALWAYASSMQYDFQLMSAVEAFFLQDDCQRVRLLTAEGVARLLWALATLQRFDVGLFGKLYQRLAGAKAAAGEPGEGGGCEDGRGKDWGRPSQGYGLDRRVYVMQIGPPEQTWEERRREAGGVGEGRGGGGGVEEVEVPGMSRSDREVGELGAVQMCQVYFSWESMKSWAALRQAELPEVDAQLLSSCQEVWVAAAEQQLLTKDQRTLLTLLSELEMEPSVRTFIMGDQVRVDVQLALSPAPLIIDFDLPPKLVSRWQYLPPHWTKASGDRVEALGCRLLQLPYAAWRRCSKNHDRRSVLRQLLEDALGGPLDAGAQRA